MPEVWGTSKVPSATSADLFDRSYKEGGRHRVCISVRDPLFVKVECLKPAFLPEEVGLFLCTCSPRTFQRLAYAGYRDRQRQMKAWKIVCKIPARVWSLLFVEDSEAAITPSVSFSSPFGFLNSHNGEHHRLTLFREPGHSWKNTFFVWAYRTCIQCLLTQEGGWDAVGGSVSHRRGFVALCCCAVLVCCWSL